MHCKYIVIWACNSISTNLHHWPFVLEAQKRGAKVVVIDSYSSRTAKAGDWHICPRPGTDGALAMGFINSMIEQGLVDQDYVDKYIGGYPELKERAAGVHARVRREDHGREGGRHRQVRPRVRNQRSPPPSASASPSSARPAARKPRAPSTRSPRSRAPGATSAAACCSCRCGTSPSIG